MHLNLKRKNSIWFEGLGQESGSRSRWHSRSGTRFEIGVHDEIRGSRSKLSFWTEVEIEVGIRGRGQVRFQGRGRGLRPGSGSGFGACVGSSFHAGDEGVKVGFQDRSQCGVSGLGSGSSFGP
ncbi:hypothetical protein TIFTF001_004542 [Ficus carica]|uniref:Uncharacterized protein n=1 Tax=Ficus carica TaxID=3494 RepID=A0AA87ZVJ3_FICCA|nr:hypothetical protein TIFTF001_004542 [Ficus carica]